jgi:hypothetical protein
MPLAPPVTKAALPWKSNMRVFPIDHSTDIPDAAGSKSAIRDAFASPQAGWRARAGKRAGHCTVM